MSIQSELAATMVAPLEAWWSNISTSARQRVCSALAAAFMRARKADGTAQPLVDATLADIAKFSDAFTLTRSKLPASAKSVPLDALFRVSGSHYDVYRRLLRGTTWHDSIPNLLTLILENVVLDVLEVGGSS